MDSIGAEVGQKMRSAIKAKLTELGCYVDDELPDYIMVMVANKRTKSQMNEDLQLFLAAKTSTFVDWLQVVLKKLKEITVTNPEIYKRVVKRKAEDEAKPSVKVKKEKKEKKGLKKNKKKEQVIEDLPHVKSLTDDIPVEASKLAEVRKIVIMKDNQNACNLVVNEDAFDIPPLSQVATSNESELNEIEKKIRSVKSRLGLQVQSESEDEDFISLKAEPEDLFPNEKSVSQDKSKNKSRKIQLVRSESQEEDQISLEQKNEHPRIVFGSDVSNSVRKQSILERLGKRLSLNQPEDHQPVEKRSKISLTRTHQKDEEAPKEKSVENNSTRESALKRLGVSPKEKSVDVSALKRLGLGISPKDKSGDGSALKRLGASPKEKSVDGSAVRESALKRLGASSKDKSADSNGGRESALKRLGVLSKVAVPQREPIDSELDVITKDVPSVVKVKPRVMPPTNKQANKNLLLKAVAEAQRSIAQTPVVGSNAKPDALYTKKYREKPDQPSRKLSAKEKNKIKSILTQDDKKKELNFSSDDDNLEYVPKPVKQKNEFKEQLEYVPSLKDQGEEDESDTKINASQTFIITLDGISKPNKIKLSPQKKEEKSFELIKKRKSPIIFDNVAPVVTKNKSIPDKLPVIVAQTAIKTKEKCKYWPNCRQSEKCEFVHPSTPCKTFPQCKFGEKCLYIHPMCKFESSCTRKDCPYGHSTRNYTVVSAPALQKCKFYPNCNNAHCMFYHPRPCKYGKFCKNQLECNFSHDFNSKVFKWRSST